MKPKAHMDINTLLGSTLIPAKQLSKQCNVTANAHLGHAAISLVSTRALCNLFLTKYLIR